MPETVESIDTGDRREEVRVTQQPGFEQQSRVVEDVGAAQRQTLSRITQILWLAAGGLESLIGLRVFLRLIGANPESPFARLVYDLTELFLWPFRGLTVTPSAGRMVLDIPAIIGMFVYAVLAYIFIKLIWVLFYRGSTSSVSVYRRSQR